MSVKFGVGVANPFGISTERESNRIVHLAIQGGIDAHTVIELDDRLNRALDRGAVRFLVELSSVDYISSAGVMRLLMLRDQARDEGGDLVVVGARPRVIEIFHLLGLKDLIRLVATPEEAWAVFGK